MQDAEIERELGGALAAIDRATLALHLSHHVDEHAERVERTRLALDCFAAALLLLETVESAFKVYEVWQVWNDEAQQVLKTARQLLADLGAWTFRAVTRLPGRHA